MSAHRHFGRIRLSRKNGLGHGIAHAEPPSTLNDLLDLQQIQQLKFRYMHAIDTQEWDLIEACFARDGDGHADKAPGEMPDYSFSSGSAAAWRIHSANKASSRVSSSWT